MGHNSDGKIDDAGILLLVAQASPTAPLILFYFGHEDSLSSLAGQRQTIHLGSDAAPSWSATT